MRMGTGRQSGEGELIAAAGASLPFSMGKTVKLKPGTSYELALYLAANREADGASTCLVDLQRQVAEAA